MYAIKKLPTLYVIRVVNEEGLDTLCYGQCGRDIFQTTSLSVAEDYRKMCQQENNMMGNPKYFVCKLEVL